jgi:hypothetical protein
MPLANTSCCFSPASFSFYFSNQMLSNLIETSYKCRLISDLVVVIVSATIGGILFSCLGQPVSKLLLSVLHNWLCINSCILFYKNLKLILLINFFLAFCKVIVGYLLAGSLIGPGGLNFINEMVQVVGCLLVNTKLK